MTTRAEYHKDTGRRLLEQARAEFASGDLLQASEKGWGAAAQMVKSALDARGEPHTGHGHLWRGIELLVDETGDAELRDLFGAAHNLHVNFYEGLLLPATVEQYLARAAAFVDRLEPLLEQQEPQAG